MGSPHRCAPPPPNTGIYPAFSLRAFVGTNPYFWVQLGIPAQRYGRLYREIEIPGTALRERHSRQLTGLDGPCAGTILKFALQPEGCRITASAHDVKWPLKRPWGVQKPHCIRIPIPRCHTHPPPGQYSGILHTMFADVRVTGSTASFIGNDHCRAAPNWATIKWFLGRKWQRLFDENVAAMLLHKAIGQSLHCIL